MSDFVFKNSLHFTKQEKSRKIELKLNWAVLIAIAERLPAIIGVLMALFTNNNLFLELYINTKL